MCLPPVGSVQPLPGRASLEHTIPWEGSGVSSLRAERCSWSLAQTQAAGAVLPARPRPRSSRVLTHPHTCPAHRELRDVQRGLGCVGQWRRGKSASVFVCE